MTVDRMEGTEPAGEAQAPAAAEAESARDQDNAGTAAGKEERPEAGSPDGAAPEADAAETQPPDTSDPSPEAAVGSSGARPLGDAEEVASRVAAAVDATLEDPSTDGGTTTSDPAAPAAAPTPDEAPAPDVTAAPEAPAQADAAARGIAGPTGAPTDAAAPAEPEATTDEDAGPPAAPAGVATGTDTTPERGAVATLTSDEASAAPPAEPEPARRDGPEPTTMEELLNEQPGEIRSLKHGDVVEGTVVRIDKDEILVDIGAKSEGVVSNRELYGRNAESQPQLNVGDTVLVYVLQPESQEGHAVLSLRRAGLERKWRSMQEQFESGVIIDAPVIDHNKGGLIVDCGIRGFVPISQIVDFPRRPQNEQPRDAAQEIAEKLQPYVGRKLRLKILEVNRKANRLILSEKVALYEERREKRDELFSSLQVGQKVTGTVRSIAPFGVFIDLGGIDGLVHKSELSWNKVNNPEAGYKVGEEVEAEVIDINHERGRISLSIRRLQPDPWHSTVADLKVNDIIDGTVTKIVNFGAFVRVRDGLEGLIHISELSHQRVAHPGDVVHEGQRLKLKIISLDSERHRLGLSLKQAEEAPPRPPEQRERRPRQERAYDASQAVQEPEGGIDNTLAAAFAQVRQQMEETEAARRDVEPPDEPVAEGAAEPGPETEAAPVEDRAPEVLADQPHPEDVPHTDGADAPALEVAPAAAASRPPEQSSQPTSEPSDVATAPDASGEASAEPSGDATATQDTGASSTPGEAAGGEPVAQTSAEPSEGAPEAAPGPDATAASAADATAGTDDSSGEPVSDTSGDPSEGAPDAAPEAGADREQNAG